MLFLPQREMPMSNTGQSYFVVDAFTDRPFSGNPAAVVPLTKWEKDEWLQNVAMEMNLAETAFFVPNALGYALRWFTPKTEVDLCGHATLASAIVLAHLGKLPDGASVGFETRSSILTASRQGSQIRLDFPALIAKPSDPPAELLRSLDVTPRYVGRNKFDFLIEVESERSLRSITPDFKRLVKVDCRGIIVTSPSDDPRFDFVSRFFAPAVGIDEDPVTGSAHCNLATFWGQKLGKTKMTGYQASARGGTVHVEVRDNRVILAGEAVIVARGELRV
jgi:PhzF family phenazine biosynthesis protein